MDNFFSTFFKTKNVLVFQVLPICQQLLVRLCDENVRHSWHWNYEGFRGRRHGVISKRQPRLQDGGHRAEPEQQRRTRQQQQEGRAGKELTCCWFGGGGGVGRCSDAFCARDFKKQLAAKKKKARTCDVLTNHPPVVRWSTAALRSVSPACPHGGNVICGRGNERTSCILPVGDIKAVDLLGVHGGGDHFQIN